MVAVVVLAMLASFLVSVWLPVAGVVIAGLYAWDLFRSLKKTEHEGSALASAMLARFIVGGTTQDRQRLVTVLDRLAATFGVDGVSAFIIEDLVYNAALVPDGDRYSLFVTSALMGDLELIELEGVIAHCLARQRLGLLTRESLACVAPASDVTRRALVGTGTAYRADEVAAAAIRYPLGLAGALHKCARQVPAPGSFFSSADYASWRWIWFDRWSDRPGTDLSDLDDVELRALALEEW